MKTRYHGRGIPYFSGPVYQRGHGIGSLFRGLFRFAMPFIKQGAKAVGRQALQTGMQVAGDVLENRPFKESVKSRVREAGSALKTKAENKVTQLLTGSGRRRARKRKAPRRIGPPKIKKQKVRGKPRDIFS
jgi:hypothetical protein